MESVPRWRSTRQPCITPVIMATVDPSLQRSSNIPRLKPVAAIGIAHPRWRTKSISERWDPHGQILCSGVHSSSVMFVWALASIQCRRSPPAVLAGAEVLTKAEVATVSAFLVRGSRKLVLGALISVRCWSARCHRPLES